MNRGEQLSLPLRRDAGHLRDYFQRISGRPVTLAVTDNSASMVSVRETGKTLAVRLHRMFLDAGDEVIGEIAAFVVRGKGATPLLRRFLRENRHMIRRCAPRKTSLRTEGRHHHLGEIFRSLNREYFGGRISGAITWGTRNPSHAVRKRTLGSYSRHGNVIRINPVLDRRNIPRYFVEFVVYHEMLHAGMDRVEKNGRRRVHSREFKERERLFGQYQKAVAWEKRKEF